MPFNRPTPQEIRNRIQAEMDITLPNSDARLRQSVEGVVSRVLAMASHEIHSFIDWVSRQILPDTAETEILDRHGAIWGIPRKPAAAATGSALFTGVIGSVIPAGTILKRGDDVQYQTEAEVTFSATTALVDVIATVPGVSGNAAIGTKLALATPVAGVQTEGTVQDDGSGNGLTGGTEIESDLAYSGRIIERIQTPPQGGSKADYVMWMKRVPGVTRAWAYPNQLGLGTVVGIFVMDDKAGSIIPSSGEVAAVQAYIDEARPTTAETTIVAPTAVPLNLTIHIRPSTLAIKAAIEAEIKDLIKREAVPGGTLYLSRINEAISVAPGEFDHILVAPVSNVVSTFGQITTLGTITWGAL